ncbi:MAG: hypothetical protein E7284_01355 [Lachnospiraceae bacterium]|nr:hypothetical protein [Lachnospiraceae bacterium]
MKKNKVNINWLAVFMIVTPLLLAGIVAIYYYLRNGGMSWVPGLKWNDEAAYYQLIKTCIATGQPIGYWGFNGNHAIMGTGSAWSPAIIWPYAIWAYIFPLSKGFVYFVNLFYITLANLIFYFCVKPSKVQSMKLILAQAGSAVFIVYLSVNMSEMFRYAIAVVLAGLLYQILFRESPKIIKYIVTPLVILGAAQVYVFFAFCVPIYIFGIMKNTKLWQKLIVSVGSLGVVAFGSYYLLHLISSNYNIHKTEALLNAIKSMDIAGAVIAFLRMMKQGAGEVFRLWTYVYTNPLIPFHVLFSVILVLISVGIIIAYFIKDRKNKANTEHIEATEKKEKKTPLGKDAIIAIIVVYSVLLFYWMYMTLYSIDPFTFMRGTYIVVIFSMYLLAMADCKWLYTTLVALQAVSLCFLPVNMEYYMSDHYMAAEEHEEWSELETAISDAIKVDDSLGPWENTVAMYTMEPKAICAMPAGIGVNFIMEDGILPKEAEYLFFSLAPANEQSTEWIVRDYETFCQEFGDELEVGYEVIFDDGQYIIYQKAE